MTGDLKEQVVDFVRRVTAAMGLALEVALEEMPDGLRIDLGGEGADVFLRRKGEVLDALQHIVNVGFRHRLDRERRIVVDALGFRKGKDAELRQMAKFVAERAKKTRLPQELGPLNPYERRIVHLAVAEDAEMASESVGDAFLKTVVISVKGS